MADIHPSACIHKSANLADDVVVGPFCVIEEGVTINQGTVLESHVVIAKDVTIGKSNRFFPFSTIGKPPQLLGLKPNAVFGKLTIGDSNTIRENVTIHPAMHPGASTIVGNENLIMVGAHIGHDCVVGDRIVMSNGCQISGHCHINTGAWLSGMVGIHQFVTIGRWVYAAGLSGITHDIPPFLIVSGHYPPMVRAVNKRGLNRAGLSEDQKAAIMNGYKKLYRSGSTLLQNALNLAATADLDENVRDMADAIIKSSHQRFGRYLETLRH
jgi:UDP-N-acetylglucosamine acyltransferase